jgi:hypothetical protein
VGVRFTDYFNHVVVPDMVLRWPDENRERLLFLRPTPNPTWLIDDVETLAAHQPIIFPLADLGPVPDSTTEGVVGQLARQATSGDTWIAEPSAVAAVAEGRADSPVIGLLAQALVRGGRGLATAGSIRDLTQATEGAFADAEHQIGERLGSSVASIETNLDGEQAGRMTRVLRAVWEGHGGSSSTFPSVASSGPLTDDDLAYLMNTLTGAAPDFWARVGKNVTTTQLGRLRLTDPSISLQNFLSANMETLTAKGMRLSSQQVRLGESESFPRWAVDRGCLAIRGASWIAHLAARKAEELPPEERGRAMSLATLRKRTSATNAIVVRVEFGKGDRSVSYESKERVNVLDDADLATVADEVRGMLVERATLAIPGAGTTNVDFGSATALGPTNSTLLLGSFARAVLPLLTPLSDEESRDLTQMLTGSAESAMLHEPGQVALTGSSGASDDEGA